MKVDLIGTGAQYTKYNSASTLVNEELLIDIPNGCHKQLLKMGFDIGKIKAVAITHFHGDHFADIAFLMRHRYQLKLQEKLIIVAPKGANEQIKKLHEVYNSEDYDWKSTIDIIEVEYGQTIELLNNYKIEVIEVNHGPLKPALGYIINNKLGFTGDSGMCDGVLKIWKKVDIMIADTSLRNGVETHMGIDNIKNLLQDVEDKKIISTHMRDKTRDALKNEKISNLIVPEDGYSFEI